MPSSSSPSSISPMHGPAEVVLEDPRKVERDMMARYIIKRQMLLPAYLMLVGFILKLTGKLDNWILEEPYQKTMAIMMQVENVIGILRELMKKSDERGALFEKELKRLGDKMDKLDRSLPELKDTSFFSKNDAADGLGRVDYVVASARVVSQ